MSYQFKTYNRLIEQNDYLKRILIIPDKDEKLNEYIKEYDRVIVDNVGIGHNNIKKTTYFSVSVRTSYVDDAVDMFRELEAGIKERFGQYYAVEIRGLSLIARLKLLYSMFNPSGDDFAKIIDLDGTGEVNLDNLRFMHLSIKDLVAPKRINHSASLKNYMILNADTAEPTYVRSFAPRSYPALLGELRPCFSFSFFMPSPVS